MASNTNPKHIAFIMDGNRRWAELNGRSVDEGHAEGAKTLLTILDAAKSLGIDTVTAFGFSSENWRRSDKEVEFLLSLALAQLNEHKAKLENEGIRFRVLGSREGLSSSLIEAINKAEKASAANEALKFNLAFNYGGRWDIVQAVKALGTEIEAGTLHAEAIDESHLTRHIQACNDPDPDILIRTSGEQRLSNFILWNLAYTELAFAPVHWPDFNKKHLTEILDDVARRKRRFGA